MNWPFVSSMGLELDHHSLMEGRMAHASRLLHLGIFSLRLDKIRYAGSAGDRRFPLLSRSHSRDIQEGLFVGQSSAIKENNEHLRGTFFHLVYANLTDSSETKRFKPGTIYTQSLIIFKC